MYQHSKLVLPTALTTYCLNCRLTRYQVYDTRYDTYPVQEVYWLKVDAPVVHSQCVVITDQLDGIIVYSKLGKLGCLETGDDRVSSESDMIGPRRDDRPDLIYYF